MLALKNHLSYFCTIPNPVSSYMSSKKGKSHVIQNQQPFWPLSNFRLVTIGSFIAAAVLYWLDFRFALSVLAVYGLLILSAPFSPRLALFLPIINKASSAKNCISLTFDDGPDPSVTSLLLDLLKQYQIKAAFFVVGAKARQNPQLIQRLIEEGHEIGNHSQNHDVFLMLRRNRTIFKEIEECQSQLIKFGIKPLAFRPPVGITNPKLSQILLQLELYCVGFSCRPCDFGNRRIKSLGKRVLSKVNSGDIVLLHDFKPNPDFSISNWLKEIEKILIGVQHKELSVVPLSQLIGKPVMKKLSGTI